MAPPLPAVQIQGLAVVNADNFNTYVQTVANFAQLRTFTALNNMTVWVLGGSAPGDGFQGEFYYSASSTASDNGSTVIVPSGAIQGAWLRLNGSMLGNTTSTSGQAAGYVGEVLSTYAFAQPINNSQQTNVASLLISAGHWVCTGSLSTSPASGTSQAFVAGGLSLTSGAFGTGPGTFQAPYDVGASGIGVNAEFGPLYFNFTSPTMVYNIQFITYSGGALTTQGGIQAQRIW